MENKQSLGKSDATYQLDFDIFSHPTTAPKPSAQNKLKTILENLPIGDSKYKENWKRARLKLKFRSILLNYMKSRQFFTQKSHIIFKKEEVVKKFVGKRIATEIFIDIEHIEPYMIHPNNPFRSFWNGVVSLLLLYTATIMPLTIAFFETDSEDEWYYIDIILNCLFFADILITFNSAYYDNCGVLISERKAVCFRYLKSWFFIDFFSCVPFNLISGANSHNFNSLLRLAKLPRLVKLLRLSRLLKVLKNNSRNSFMSKIEDVLNIKTSVMRLFQGFMTAILLVHLMACIWFYSAKFQDFEANTWVVRFGYMDMSVGSLYLRSIYFIITTLATVGYGDIYPCNNIERILVIMWIIIVMFFMTFNISSMSNMISNIDTKDSILQYKTTIIEDFCKENKLNKELRFRLKEAIKYSTEQNGGSLYNKQELILHLPNKLRFEVALAMHKGLAREIWFFQQYNSVFVSSIIPLLISQRFHKDSVIYKEKDHPDEVYFIVSGRVGYVADNNLAVFQQNFKSSCFGFFEIFNSTHRMFTTRAMISTEVLTLKKNLLIDVLKEFPVVEQQVKAMIEAEKLKTLRNWIEFKVILELKTTCKIKEMNLKQIRQYIQSRFVDYQNVWRELELKEIGIDDLVLTCVTLKGKIEGLEKLYASATGEIKIFASKVGALE